MQHALMRERSVPYHLQSKHSQVSLFSAQMEVSPFFLGLRENEYQHCDEAACKTMSHNVCTSPFHGLLQLFGGFVCTCPETWAYVCVLF